MIVDSPFRSRCSQRDARTLSSPVEPDSERRWYAVFTTTQHEKSAVRQLGLREIESFLPTYETMRVWKNRQRVKLVLPLFPSYLFVRISTLDRGRVLQSPGVLRIVGNKHELHSISDVTIEFLRSAASEKKIEPYPELAVGQKVRIKCGPMRGLQGVLARKGKSLRFVLNIDHINRQVAVEIDGANLEPTL
jgi:transcription antitermination factor NusG